MKHEKDTLTGEYYQKVQKRASKIEKNSKKKRIIRAIMAFLLVLICAGGLYWGYNSKAGELMDRYQNYMDHPNQSELNEELLAYKDTYEHFVEAFLGNSPEQLQMGGLFYQNAGFSISPSENGKSMILTKDGKDSVLFRFLADNINVKGQSIFYRNPSSRDMFVYDMTNGKQQALELHNVGQFALCGEYYYFIDIDESALVKYDPETKTRYTITDGDVSSFAIAGDLILYLTSEHELHSYSISNQKDAKKANNIDNFFFNGSIWLQNGEDVYKQPIGEKAITKVNLGHPCARLLGVIGSVLYYSTGESIFAYDIEKGSSREVDKGIFIGGSENKCLTYSIDDEAYYLVDTN